MRRLYFGHPINTYDTELEQRLLKKIAFEFPDAEIVNPNGAEHQEAYKRLEEETGDGMPYFTELAESCDLGVFLPFMDGKWGAGVAKEIDAFLRNGKAAYEIRTDRSPQAILFVGETRILSVEETRARIRDEEGNRLPYSDYPCCT